MEGPRVLSGEVLVAKGITKTDASLPEVGLKDVTPNGSWLEQKQIQAALEARNNLIAVERIEKCGTLSHAEWHDDLKLAKVTQKVGGHWQYFGHNVGKSLFLRPDEALFLMEVNCLLLKHNEVTVSLQKAYSLLLNSSTAMIEYRVFASLSRLGYRVFRHSGLELNKEKNIYSQKCIKVYELKNGNSPKFSTVGKDNELKNLNSPTAVTNKSPVVSTLNNSEHEPIVLVVKASENNDHSTVSPAIDSDKAESVKLIDNMVTDSKSNNSPTVSQVSKLSENKEIEINNQEVKRSDTNENIEMGEVKDIEVMTEQCDAENSVAKENESPNVMDVDEDVELKNTDNEIENVQEISPTSVENDVDSMDICFKDQERIVIVIMQEKKARPEVGEAISAKESSSVTSSDVPIRFVQMVDSSKDGPSVTYVEIETKDTGTQTIEERTESLEVKNEPNSSNSCTLTENITQNVDYSSDNDSYSYLNKIEKIIKSQLKPTPSQTMEDSFKDIPDFLKESVVTINVPEQQFIPNNIFVNKANYKLDLENIKMRSFRSASSESPAYTSSDEVNGTNIRRIRSSSDVLGGEIPQNSNFFPHGRLPRYQPFRPYGFWRPQNNLNYYQLMFFQTRIQYNQRNNPFLRSCFNFMPNNPNLSHNARKRMRTCKSAHFQSIKNLAARLKQCLISGNTDMENLRTLHSLLHSYNQRYKTRLRLTGNFDVVNEEKIVDTIDLEDDDEVSKRKKPRQEKDDDKFNENLYRLRQLATRLRNLEIKNSATATHRRALSKAIKTFNKSYDADIYLDFDTYEVIDRRFITLSSSDSDCVVEEEPRVRPKKLKNPFSILKRRSERMLSSNTPSTSNDDSSDPSKINADPAEPKKENNEYNKLTVTTFTETWLPNEKDFGRAEIVPKRLMNSRIMFCNKEQFLFEFMRDDFQQHQNWSEAKISFLRYLEETNISFKSEESQILSDPDLCSTGLKPLLDCEDTSDMHSVLEKLRIIENNKDIDTETSLRVCFDVYNRNVQNFRKKCPPKPHFRIICVEDTSGVPSAAEVMSLHSKYKDNVPIVFAIVSTGSISYLQMNPIDLPVYVPSSDVV